jgi:hypothetical protein
MLQVDQVELTVDTSHLRVKAEEAVTLRMQEMVAAAEVMVQLEVDLEMVKVVMWLLKSQDHLEEPLVFGA